MSIVIPTSREQYEHVATAIMTGIHDVFPANIVDSNDPISKKKLLKGEGQYSLFKMLLGFDFDGKRKTMWLEEEKRAKLLTILHSWLQAGSLNCGIPFGEFKYTHLPPYQAAGNSSHRATVSSKNVHQWCTSIATPPYMRQYQTAERFYGNQRVVQRAAAN
jgi:hypothetical protein